MAVTLDPAPARQLTSHELAKIFSGMLGGIAASDPPARDEFIGLLEFSMFKLEHDEPQLPHLGKVPPLLVGGLRPTSWHTAMLSTVAGLSTWCRMTDLHTALLWLRHNVETMFPSSSPN